MIRLISFGYKHREAPRAHVVYDVRNLPNPHKIFNLRGLTGLDDAVSEYLLKYPGYTNFLKIVIPSLHVDNIYAFGCHGGRHRSVAVAEALGYHLSVQGEVVEVNHLELDANHIYRNGSEIRHARGPASISPQPPRQ